MFLQPIVMLFFSVSIAPSLCMAHPGRDLAEFFEKELKKILHPDLVGPGAQQRVSKAGSPVSSPLLLPPSALITRVGAARIFFCFLTLCFPLNTVLEFFLFLCCLMRNQSSLAAVLYCFFLISHRLDLFVIIAIYVIFTLRFALVVITAMHAFILLIFSFF